MRMWRKEALRKIMCMLLCLVMALGMLLPVPAFAEEPAAEPCIHGGGTATCTAQAVCEICGEAYGELVDHSFGMDGLCSCGAECEHSYEEGVCAVCGMTDPNAEPECNCGVKCDKTYRDEECPVCATGALEACQGNEVSAYLSGSYTGNGTMQYNQSGTTIDVQGTDSVKTTYGNNGYELKTSDSLTGKVAASASFVNGGSYVKLSYTVTNNTSSSITGAIGICADVQIGNDDNATITAIKNAEGTSVIGLKMVDTNKTGNRQFNLYFRGTAGVTDADRYWIGAYSSGGYKNHWNDTSDEESFSGGDSALAVSWDVSLAAGESKTYSVIVGVGAVAEPPRFGENPVALTMSAEATQDNLLIHVSAKVRDADGVTDTLYYNENGGVEWQLGAPVVGDGGTEQEITGVIDLTGKPDGTYQYQFWIVNDKGAASEVVERTITITNGTVTGDVTVVASKYNVSVVPPANGSLSVSSSIVGAGTEITVTFAPAEGYELDTISVTDGSGAALTLSGTGNTRTFTMPAGNVTVTATFRRSVVFPTEYTIEGAAYTSGTTQWFKGGTCATIKPLAGYTIGASENGTFSDSLAVTEKPEKVYFKTAAGEVSPAIEVMEDLRWDAAAPSGVITLDEQHQWSDERTSLSNLFVKGDPQRVTIAADDQESGVKSIEYFVSERAAAVNNMTWTAYADAAPLNARSANVVYARITDNVGNVRYVNTDCIILYCDSAADTQTVDYIYRENADKDVAITLNGNTVKAVSCGGTALRKDVDYAATATGITLKKAYLNTFHASATPYVFAVIYNPLGIAADEADNVDLADTTFAVEVSRKSLADARITLSDTVIFDEQAAPSVTVTLGGETLSAATDYTVAEVTGDGIVVTAAVTGKGNYKDTATAKPTYLVVKLPKAVQPDNKSAIDAYDLYSELYKTYTDEELAVALAELKGELTAYEITHQSARYYERGSGKLLTFTANGYYSGLDSYAKGYYGKFAGVKIDGKLLDPKHYSAKSGSTVITMSNAYLNSLEDGTYYIQVVYMDGSTGGEDSFRVTTGTGIPATGDGNTMLVTGVMMTILLTVAMAILALPRKKGRYQR